MNLGPYRLFDIIEQNEESFFQICTIVFDIEEPLNHSFTPNNISPDNKTLETCKEHNDGQVSSINQFIEKVKDYLSANPNSTKRKNKKYLFNGKPIGSSYPSRPLKELLEMVGVDTSYSTHTFRHGFITDLFRKDVSLTKIGNVVGHSDRRMTELYGHLDTTDMVSVLDKV